MNILVVVKNTKLVGRIVQNVKFNKCYLVSTEKIKKKYQSINQIYTYLMDDVMYNSYFNNFDWNNIQPLDQKTVMDMYQAQVETLIMYDKFDLPTYNERYTLYIQQLRFWSDFLDKNDIRLYIRDHPGHGGYDHIIYHLCKYKNIPVILHFSMYPGYKFMFDDIYNFMPELKEEYEKNKAIYQDIEIDSIILPNEWKKIIDQHWNKQSVQHKPIVIPKGKLHRRRHKELEQSKKKLWNSYDRQCVSPNYSITYLYYALHFQPEASTSPLGGVFCDQLLIASILSQLGIQIYVKEHPRLSSNRTKEFYEYLLSLKNVYLIRRDQDSYKLIDNSLAVVTATGTAGWEAVLRGKPVLMFGHNFYQYAPGVFKVGSVNDCKSALSKISLLALNKKDVILFVLSLQPFIFKKGTQEHIDILCKRVNQLVEGGNK